MTPVNSASCSFKRYSRGRQAVWLGVMVVLLGLGAHRWSVVNRLVLVVDLSGCQPEAWEQVVGAYAALQHGHQRDVTKIWKVILLSDVEEREHLPDLPSSELRTMKMDAPLNRRLSPEQLATLLGRFRNAQLLTCDRELRQQLNRYDAFP